MTLEIALVLGITVLVFGLFVSEKLAPDLIALCTLVAVTLCGLITVPQAFASFANEAPITVAAMFILSTALQRCGAIEDMGRWIRRLPPVGEVRILLVLLLSVAAASAFVNNTPVVVAFMPLVLGISRHYDISPSKLLIPLSFAAIFGGTCSLIGTSTNLVVASVARDYGVHFGIFDISGMGVITALVGIGYMATVGRRLLPSRVSLAALVGESRGTSREFIAELLVRPGSSLDGQRLGAAELASIQGVRVQEVVRDGIPLPGPLRDIILRDGDHLILGCHAASIAEVDDLHHLGAIDERGLGLERLQTGESVIVEAVVTNNSRFAGATIRELDLRTKHQAALLAMHRFGENLTRNLDTLPLRFGDTLLLRLPETAMAPLRDSRDLLLLTDTTIPKARRAKRPIVLAVLAAVVGLAAFNVQPISILALAGVVTIVLTRCLQLKEMYEAIDWRIVSMIVGMLALGTAMETTGGAQWAADGIVGLLGDASPILLLAAFYGVATLLTEMISNNAVAILMGPLAAKTALSLGLDPKPFLVAIMFAASASFATPIGYQTNTFVYGAGGYRFRDFLRVGIPLNLLFWLLAVALIPLFWPLRPAP